MKHLSLLLTVLTLGAMPLTAAALDYGPNHPLLAAENGAPPLPGAQAHGGAPGAMPKPDVAEVGSGEGAEAPTRVPRPALPASPPVVPRSDHQSSASNKPRDKIAEPASAPGPASWQSLLPGSIQ